MNPEHKKLYEVVASITYEDAFEVLASSPEEATELGMSRANGRQDYTIETFHVSTQEIGHESE